MDRQIDSARDPQAQAWDKAVILLRQSGMSDKAARVYFGRILKHNTLRADELADVLEACKRAGTLDAQGYLWKAAEGVARSKRDPGLQADWT